MRIGLALAAATAVVALPAAGSTPGARILFNEPHDSSSDLVEIDTSHRDSNVSTEIYVMNADGSNQRRLTLDGPEGVQSAGGELFDSDPVWAPGGATIAYLKGVSNSDDVWLMRSDGSDQRRITTDGGYKTSLAWAPNGGRLVYESGGAIFLVVEGDAPVRVATGTEPGWSSDGSRIAYVAADGLWTIGADGGNPTHVTTMPAHGPSWSPDGTRLAFEGTRSFPELAKPEVRGALPKRSLHDPPGRHRRAAADRPAGGRILVTADGFEPHVVAGRLASVLSLTASAERAGHHYVMNLDGSCEGAFAIGSASLRRPVWRPGSQPGLGPTRCADLRVTLDLSGGAVGPSALGQASEFRFDIDNDGSETGTGLRAELKASVPVEILEGDDPAVPCSGSPHDLVCRLPSLAPASADSVSFLVRSRVAGTFPLSLSVSAFEPDSDPSTNTTITSTQVLPCDRVGTYGDDVLYGTTRRDRICALPGADRVYGGSGNDYLDAGNGNDIIAAGPGRDVIVAKGGNDTIYARDGEKDTIDCSTERDVAIVDRLDVVRRCDTVVRR